MTSVWKPISLVQIIFFFPKKKLTNVFGTVEKVFLFFFFFLSQGLFFFTLENHLSSSFFFFENCTILQSRASCRKGGRQNRHRSHFRYCGTDSIIRHTHNRSQITICITRKHGWTTAVFRFFISRVKKSPDWENPVIHDRPANPLLGLRAIPTANPSHDHPNVNF